jgi:DNA-binding NarL/FixJ family response regulator
MSVTSIVSYEQTDDNWARSKAAKPVRSAADLTPTQMKVLHGVNCGLLNKQIAYNLGIAEATVKAHMTALMRKLNVGNRTQVVIAARALGRWSGEIGH